MLAKWLIYIAGILWGIELIPQIWKTYKTKNVEGISPIFFFMCLLAYVLYIIGNLLTWNLTIVISHLPSLVGNSIMTYMVVKYRRK